MFIYQVIPLAERIVGISKRLCNYVVREGSATYSISVKKLSDNLICKSDVFQRFPETVVANDFMLQAIRAYNFEGEDYAKVIKIIKDNKNISKKTSGATLRFVHILISLLGCHIGSKVLGLLINIKRILTEE